MRPGHHRPLGTTTRITFRDGGGEAASLGDVIHQISAEHADDADYVQRAYRVVGQEELRTGRTRLVLERVEYGTEPEPGCISFPFWRVPR